MRGGWVRTDGRDVVMMVPQAAMDVFKERRRQVYEEVWTPEHDDRHDRDEMPLAAACYALTDNERDIMCETGNDIRRELWPWDPKWWKPTDRRRDLVKAAALLIAEIERIDRTEARKESEK